MCFKRMWNFKRGISTYKNHFFYSLHSWFPRSKKSWWLFSLFSLIKKSLLFLGKHIVFTRRYLPKKTRKWKVNCTTRPNTEQNWFFTTEENNEGKNVSNKSYSTFFVNLTFFYFCLIIANGETKSCFRKSKFVDNQCFPPMCVFKAHVF